MFARMMYRLWSFVVSSTRLWDLLDSTGIVVFVGPNGSGKSLVMVQAETRALAGIEWECWDADHRHHGPFARHCEHCPTCDRSTYGPHAVRDLDALRRIEAAGVVCADGAALLEEGAQGVRRVYSTVPLTISEGVPHPLYVPLTDYRQLLTIEHADVLFDEVAGIADASGSASMPVQVVNWQHQLRKRDVRQRVTTPAYARCALPIRQVAQVVVEMRSFFPARASGALWRQRRLVYAVAYDANSFDDFIASDGQRDRLQSIARGLVWVPTSDAIRHYNSLGQVLSLGHVTEGGMCIACGGTRSRPKCGCPVDHDGEDLSELVIETTVSAAGTRTKRAVPRASLETADDASEVLQRKGRHSNGVVH
jgi:hypothetical protein